MGSLSFVGLGLCDEKGMSLYGLELARSADIVLIETYTNIMPSLNIRSLEALIGKEVKMVDRHYIEDGSHLLRTASEKDVALLVPGDPFIATTHVELRVRAERRGILVRVAHAPSIISVAPGVVGLQNYKFGRSATITFPDNYSEVPYDTIIQNRRAGLHTLLFLDLRAEEGRYMSVQEGIRLLMEMESRRGEGAVCPDTLMIGIARAGSPDQLVKGGRAEDLASLDFGPPPHSLIVPGRLHFMEAEALEVLARVDRSLLSKYVERV
ncbi:MAG: diphthine synthase [Candidatus Methanomethyliales bacterium]|nr:diphthine synthase [Candidatus Methanomethylicales archaeon]